MPCRQAPTHLIVSIPSRLRQRKHARHHAQSRATTMNVTPWRRARDWQQVFTSSVNTVAGHDQTIRRPGKPSSPSAKHSPLYFPTCRPCPYPECGSVPRLFPNTANTSPNCGPRRRRDAPPGYSLLDPVLCLGCGPKRRISGLHPTVEVLRKSHDKCLLSLLQPSKNFRRAIQSSNVQAATQTPFPMLGR